MRVLHAYNEHRSGGGATKVAKDTIAVSERNGIDVRVLRRQSRDLARPPLGHLQAAVSAFRGSHSRREFRTLLDSFQPDVVHVHELFPLVSPWVIPEASRRGIPVVMTWYDYHMSCPARNHYYRGEICTRCVGGNEYWSVVRNCRENFVESAAMALYCAMTRKLRLYTDHVSEFIVASDFAREWLIENGGADASRVTAIAPLLDMPPVAADPAAGRYFAFAGRMVPEKGIDVLIEAARISGVPLRMSRNEAHFVTVDIPENIEVVVTSRPEEIHAFYRGARAVVMPSTWFETFGMVGAEAMSHGIPVVVSRLGALANLVEDGVSGLLFEAGNPRDLAAKLTQLWTDTDLARRLGSAGRQRVASLWTAERHFDTLLSVYERVTGRAFRKATGTASPEPVLAENER